MHKSTARLPTLLQNLTACARRKGWTDAEWSRRAGVPKETLCRLRSRTSCDFATLAALASAVGATLAVDGGRGGTTPDRLWPERVDRTLESQLVQLASTHSTRPEDWRAFGPGFFLAGLAATLASVTGFDRPKYLALADALHPGVTEPRVLSQWLAQTPLPPSRFLPMLRRERARAA